MSSTKLSRLVPNQTHGSCKNVASFAGEVVRQEDYDSGKIDMEDFLPKFLARHPKELRFPEIESCARSLKQEHGFKKVGAMAFCWGGWAVFQLGAKGKSPLALLITNINPVNKLTWYQAETSSTASPLLTLR